MRGEISLFFLSALIAKVTEKSEIIYSYGYHAYRHLKAKLLILDPSEGRGFNFHTLAKKLVLD